MDFLQFQQFQVVAKHENITNAAEELFMTQPGLSRSLKKLESEVGCLLFDRNKNRLTLNKNGKLFLKYVNKIFEDLSEFHEELGALNKEDHDSIKIFSFSTAFNYFIMPYLAEKSNHLIIGGTIKISQIDQMLLNENCDLVVSNQKSKNNEIGNIHILRDILYVNIPKENNLSKKEYVSFRDLENEEFIIQNEGLGFTEWINALTEKYHVSLNFVSETNITSVLRVVQSQKNKLLSFTSTLSNQFLDSYDSTACILVKEKDIIFRDFFLCYKKSNYNKVSEIIDLFKDDYKEMFSNDMYLFPHKN